jgi:hypothetical protein
LFTKTIIKAIQFQMAVPGNNPCHYYEYNRAGKGVEGQLSQRNP